MITPDPVPVFHPAREGLAGGRGHLLRRLLLVGWLAGCSSWARQARSLSAPGLQFQLLAITFLARDLDSETTQQERLERERERVVELIHSPFGFHDELRRHGR